MKHLKLLQVLLFVFAIPFFFSACEKSSDPVSSNDDPPAPQRADGVIYGKSDGDNHGSTAKMDYNGRTYNLIRIGNRSQWWMAENLQTTQYNDGAAIPNVTDQTAWANQTAGAYCAYNNSQGNADTYGYLYNWHAVSTDKLAPAGWRVPNEADWNELVTALGGDTVAGGKLKNVGTTYWLSPNTGATNESGFAALPGGIREGSTTGSFDDTGVAAKFASSTEDDPTNIKYFRLNYATAEAFINEYLKTAGYSVRLVFVE